MKKNITPVPTDLSEACVKYYFDDLSRQPLVTPEEEVALVKRIHQGDQKALDRLVCANLRFVVSIAKQYQNKGLNLADLISEGNIGLIKAAQKFDYEKGNKFISYAVWCINSAIKEALESKGRTIYLPHRMYADAQAIKAAQAQILQEEDRPATVEELVEKTGLDKKKVYEILNSETHYASLDASIYDDSKTALKDQLSESLEDAPNFELERGSFENRLDLVMHTVLKKERDINILRQYYGLGCDAKSVNDLSDELNLTRERIRQILSESLEKLRHSSASQQLRMCC